MDLYSTDDDVVIISDDDYSIDSLSTTYTIFDEISEENDEFLDSEKISGNYYLGLCRCYRNKILMDCVVSPNNFMKYNIEQIQNYLDKTRALTSCGSLSRNRKTIQIMKLYIDQKGFYNAVLKTFWIRLIQRTWKRVFRERQQILKKRASLKNLRIKEITGKHMYELNTLPTVYGILSYLHS